METIRAKYADAMDEETLICFENEKEAKAFIKDWENLKEEVRKLKKLN